MPPIQTKSINMDDKDNNHQHETIELSNSKTALKPSGAGVIKSYAKKLPDSPGVYRMLDKDDNVLYVGKARSLKKRVTSYTRLHGHTTRILRMISQTVSMEFLHTRTETEALLLEANLIKSLKPRYNILLRDDKSFPYILLANDHEAPQILRHRGARKRKGKYYGPFASPSAVYRTMHAMQRAFLLRSCQDSVYASRSRPCLLYQIKRCSGPCTKEISLENYGELVKEADEFLSGGAKSLLDKLSKRMYKASEDLEFEEAAQLRDRISSIEKITGHHSIQAQSLEDGDIFACHLEGGQSCVEVFFYRLGQNWGNRAYYPRHDKEATESEILAPFIAQFYTSKPIPPTVLVSHPLEEEQLLSEALSESANQKVTLSTPKRGEKRQIVAHALKNAQEALARRLSEAGRTQIFLEKLSVLFEMEETPKRVEIYDNSHIQGTNAVGAMVVAGEEGFLKNHYRKYNIKNSELTPGDDFAMMREVLTRRFGRLIKENGKNKDEMNTSDPISIWPDLILIDGGKGQLSAAQSVFDELGIDDITLVAISKGPDRNAGREEFHMSGKPTQTLPLNDPVLHYLQRLRDEAHRFAIGTHRAKRAKAQASSPLDNLPGIGPSRKKALLAKFGSAKAVKSASVEELMQTEGISKTRAVQIYDYFHE